MSQNMALEFEMVALGEGQEFQEDLITLLDVAIPAMNKVSP